MKIIKNEKLIERNGKIGNWTTLGALIVLGGGAYISFSKPELFIYSLFCLILGFILTQIGMYMSSRWGRSPRPDEKIDSGLKGLHSEFHLYHYASPTSHLLIGPAGVWVILPFHQRGRVEYKNHRWRLRGGGFLQAYMRIFGQEGLGRPEVDARNEINLVTKYFSRVLEQGNTPAVNAVLAFTDDKIELDVGDSPIPAMKLKQLKEFLRQESKKHVLTIEQIQGIVNSLG